MLLEKKARVSVRGHSLLRVFLMKIFSLFFFFFFASHKILIQKTQKQERRRRIFV
jgi:hypothetical protein